MLGHDERQDDSSRKKEEADGIGVSSSCSSPEGKPLSGEDFSYSLEMTDESVLDGEVGKRLNQMVPVPVSSFYGVIFEPFEVIL